MKLCTAAGCSGRNLPGRHIGLHRLEPFICLS